MSKKIFNLIALLSLFALVVSACAPAPAATEPQIVVQTQIVAGEPVVKEVVITATPEPVQAGVDHIQLVDWPW